MKTTKMVPAFICFLLLLNVLPATADVRLPAIFGDGMVLQQKAKAPIWGWAEPGEKIYIKGSWQWTGTSTTADKDGNWLTKIKTPKAGGPFTISIAGKNKIIFKDVLIGEVWICSGQSNMGLSVSYSANAQNEIAAANYPNIRFFNVNMTIADKPQKDCVGSWHQCTPETAAEFSAAAYYFGRQLHQELNVPIGLIHASKGGSPAEAWIRKEVLEAEPDFASILERFAKGVADFPLAKQEYAQKLEEWTQAVNKAKADHTPIPSKPYVLQMEQTGPGHYQSPSCLYNGMIAPLVPYRIRGVIWYQGECNSWRAWQYRKLFPAMIANWRDDWGQGQFPFYYVQIASFDYSIFDNGIEEPIVPELREAQTMALNVPDTGMAVTMDISDINNIHPENKQDVGKRLALWALAKTYGHKNIVYSGPLYKSMAIEQKTENSKPAIRLFFDHVGSGLTTKGGKLTDFTIAGEDGKFVEANAEIDNNTIVVSSEKVRNPVAVRYAWTNTAMPNLFNKEGLPASSFRTDDWPCVTANRK
jgi:sialate O-acetylesterase